MEIVGGVGHLFSNASTCSKVKMREGGYNLA
jgi:hypothetical protein